MGSEVVLIDPARETAAEARTQLAHQDKLATCAQDRVRLCFSAQVLASYGPQAKAPEFALVNLTDYRVKSNLGFLADTRKRRQ